MQDTVKVSYKSWIVDAVISSDANYTEYAHWNNGVWYSGTWNKGFFYVDSTPSIHSKEAQWHNGHWKDGLWKGGVWNAGTWSEGKWWEGYWFEGSWINGKWYNGLICNKKKSNYFGSVFSPKSYFKPNKTLSLNYAKYKLQILEG